MCLMRKSVTFIGRKKSLQVWNLLSRLPLEGTGQLIFTGGRGRTSIIFLAAIVMRLAEIPREEARRLKRILPVAKVP